MNNKIVAIVDHVGLKAGMECYDLDLYAGLKNAGYEPVVYSNFSDKEEGLFPFFNFRLKENLFSFYKLLTNYDRIASEIKNRNIKYCILHGFRFGFWEWFIIQKIKRSSAKIFLIVHDPESLVVINKQSTWKKKIFNLCHRIIVHNKFSYEQLAVELPVAEIEKLVIIPHGNFTKAAEQSSDSVRFMHENNLTSGKKNILFFGQIKESKGLDLLLEAFTKTDNAADLIIAGRMRRHSFEKYEELIHRYNLKDRIKLFIGYISPEMRNDLFHLADVVVLPYRKVYQSGVMLMAMSYGKAVIASDLPPNKEIISHGENGLIFSSGSKDELAKMIEDVIKNDSMREEIAKNGLQFVRQKLDWNRIALEWVKQFQS